MKTKLRSLEGEMIIVPNILFITSSPIINYTSGEFIKIKLPIMIDSKSDYIKVKQIIEKICLENNQILPNIPQKKISTIEKIFSIQEKFFETKRNIEKLKPYVIITSLNRDSIGLEVCFWIWDIAQKDKIISSFYDSVLNQFKENKIILG